MLLLQSQASQDLSAKADLRAEANVIGESPGVCQGRGWSAAPDRPDYRGRYGQGLTNTGLNDNDGDGLADTLFATPLRAAGCRPGTERLDLTRINFGPVVRTRLSAAGTFAGVEVCMSRPNGPALRAGR